MRKQAWPTTTRCTTESGPGGQPTLVRNSQLSSRRSDHSRKGGKWYSSMATESASAHVQPTRQHWRTRVRIWPMKLPDDCPFAKVPLQQFLETEIHRFDCCRAGAAAAWLTRVLFTLHACNDPIAGRHARVSFECLNKVSLPARVVLRIADNGRVVTRFQQRPASVKTSRIFTFLGSDQNASSRSSTFTGFSGSPPHRGLMAVSLHAFHRAC
ncbi:hypothetical protein SAMN05443247_04405 [Bradyrhizobium erythrophlei]|jgi:hypothetical protein|nr:hypothetical protein SAMN05443247_04405 [Bradyrhizobium erythrophlei]